MAKIKFDDGTTVEVEGEPSHDQVVAIWNDLQSQKTQTSDQPQTPTEAPQAPTEVQPQNRFMDILGSAAQDSVNAIPALNPIQASKTLASPIPFNAQNEDLGTIMNRSMGVDNNPVTPQLSLNPAVQAGQMAVQNPKQFFSMPQRALSEQANAFTTPMTYMIPYAIEAGLAAADLIPMGETTLGNLLKIPVNRIKDAIKGDVAPEVVDRFVQRLEWAKKYSKHLPQEMKNQKFKSQPNPDQASVPNIPKNEVIPQAPIEIPGQQAQGTGETKVRGLSKSIQERSGKDLGELPNYNVLQDKEQRRIFNAHHSANPERVLNVAMGKEPAPPGATGSAFLKYLEEKALKEGDLETLRKLATQSDVLKQATEAGQFVSSLRDMNPESPVKAVDEIVQAREAKLKSRNAKPENQSKINELQKRLDESEKNLKEFQSKQSEKLKPSSKEFGSKNKLFTKDVYNIASINLKAKLSGLHSGIDPTAIKEVTQIGGYYFEGGLIEFNEWSSTMIKEFGEQIKPYLEDAWKHINTMFEMSERNKILGKISKAVSEGDNLSEVGFQINKIAKEFISQGIKDRESLVDAVYKVLKDVIPDITKRETQDAISGYGKYKMLSKGEIEVKLRDLKGQMQQVSKLEDLQAKKSPLKTGIERRTPSDEERRLISQVNEAKKRFKIENTNPETQLKSAIESSKTRILNQIKDLKTQIESKEKFVKEKYSTPDTPEIAKLRSQRDKLKDQFYEIFGKPGMSDEARLEKALESTRKSISEYNRRIKEGDLSPMKEKGSLPKVTPELEKAWKLRDQLKEQYRQLKDAQRVKKSPQEIRLQSLKTRLANRIGELEQRLTNRNFSSNIKNTTALDPEAIILKNKVEQSQMAYDAAKKSKPLISDAEVNEIVKRSKNVSDAKALVDPKSPAGSPSRLKYGRALADFGSYVSDLKHGASKMTLADFKANPLKSTLKAAVDASGIAKALRATGDLSMLLRQGFRTAITHPDIWLENAGKSFVDLSKTFGKENVARETKADILSRPLSMDGTYKKYGLNISTVEEQYPSSLPEKIPGFGKIFKGFEDAYVNFLHKTRADVFDKVYSILDKSGGNKEGLGNFVNSLTARGNLGFLEPVSKPLNNIFFSVRNLASEVEFLTAHSFDSKMSPELKSMARANLAKVVTAVGTILGIAKAIDPKSVTFDLTNADFGKIKIGDTRYDITGGMGAIIVLASRFATQKYTSSVSGKKYEYNTGKYGSKTVGDAFSDFAQNRLSPVGSLINDIKFRGRTFEGSKPTLGYEASNLTVPFPITSAQELLKDPNKANFILGLIANQVGINTSTYSNKKAKK